MASDTPDPPYEQTPADRRKEDRRKAQVPFEGPDRRKADRRSGADRRTTPRSPTGGDGGS